MFTKTKKAFTLVELLVVVAIIGILAVIIIINILSARQKAIVSRIQADLSTVTSAYASAIADGAIIPGAGNANDWVSEATSLNLNLWKVGNQQTLASLPESPLAGQKYWYRIESNTNSIAGFGLVKNEAPYNDEYVVCSHNGKTGLMGDTDSTTTYATVADILTACWAY